MAASNFVSTWANVAPPTYPQRAPSFFRSLIRRIHEETAQHGFVKQVVQGLWVSLLGIGMWSGPGAGIDELTTMPSTGWAGSSSRCFGFRRMIACGAAIVPWSGGQSLTQ